MATYYWVGGSGNWGYSETTNWALSSGGAGGAGFPTPYDNVVFDANSNTGTAAFAVTVTGVSAAPSTCANFDASAVDGVMTLTLGATAAVNVYGSWVNPASNFAFSLTAGHIILFGATALGKTVNLNNVSAVGINLTFSGVGGGWTLTGAVNCPGASGAITVTSGSFDTGNQAISVGQFNTTGTTTRSVTLGSSTITLGGVTPWNAASTGLTFNAGTSTIVCSSASSLTFAGGGLTYNNVSFTDSTSVSKTISITSQNTYNNLTFTSPSVAGIKLIAFGANQVVNGTLTLGSGGTASNRLWVLSIQTNTQRTITAATLAAMSDVDFSDIAVAGAAAPFTGTRIGNRGNNSNITFTAAKTVYWSLVAGGNWSATAWASSSGGAPAATNFPLAQDTAIIDDTGLTTGNTITVNADYWAFPALNVTKTGAFTIAVGNLSPYFYGDVTLQAATTTTGGTGAWTFSGYGITQTLTTNGATISTSGVSISNFGGGTLQLGSALTTTGAITVTSGTFSTANYNVSATALNSNNSNTRTVSLGSSTVTLTGATPVDFTTTTGLTFNAGTSTINCSSALAITFAGNGLTYYNVSLTNATSTGVSNFITGANTFNNLTFTNPSVAGIKFLSITANQTINGTFNPGTGGTATSRIFIRSNVLGTPRTITAATLASTSDVDFRDITAAGASAPWSGTRIGNALGNSNITFPAAKTVYWNLAGAQNWSATGWATSSGGAPAAANFPLAQDTAVFDNTGSVTGTITIDTSWQIGTLNVTKTGAMTLAAGGSIPSIFGNVTLQAATIVTGTGAFTFYGTGTQVLTSNNCSFAPPITLSGAGGTVQLGSNFTTTSATTISHTYGTFDLNNFNLTAAGISSSNTNTRAILLGSGTHTFSGATAWDTSTTTGLTLTRGTSTIVCSFGSALTFAGGGLTYYNVSFTSTVVTNTTITGANTYNNLTFATPGSVGNKNIIINGNQTIQGILTWGSGGTATNRINVLGGTIGSQTTITAATLAAMSDVDFRDIAAAGASAPWSGTRIGNIGNNNSGITFTAAKTVYWSLAAGGTWQSSTAWATSSGGAPAITNFPLAQDTAIIDDTGITTGNTINIGGANIGTLNVTKTNAVTLAFATSPSIFSGNATVQANTIVTGTNIWNFYNSSGTSVLTTNGSVLAVGIQLQGGNLQLGTAVTTTGAFTLTTGALDLNNYTLTGTTFSSTNSNTRSIAFGSTGNITVTGNNATVFNMTTVTNFSYTGTPTVNLTYSGSVGQRNIAFVTGATETNVLSYNVTAGGDTLSIIVSGTGSGVKNLNLTGYTGALINLAKTVYGNSTAPASVAIVAGANVTTYAATSGTQILTTNGVVQDYPIVFSGTATYQLAGNLTVGGLPVTNSVVFTSGTIDLNSYVLSANIFSSNNSNTRAIAFNGGSISVTGNNTTVWSMAIVTGFTYTGTSVINLTYASSVGTRTVTMGTTGGNETYAMNFNVTAGSDIYSHTVTAKNLNLTGFSGTYTNIAKNIFGNFTMPSGVTVAAGTITTNFTATTGTQVISTNSVVQDYPINLNGAAATIYQFADALTMGSTRQLQLLNGTIKFKASTTNTVGSFVTSGTTQKYLQSDTAGTQATLSQASGTVNANYLTLQDNNATGGATFNAFTDAGSTSSNNNIINTNVTGWNRIPSSTGFLMFF